MEKIIIERNEDIIKEKTKNLNMKYKNYAWLLFNFFI